MFLNASYGDPKVFRVTAFVDAEFINYDSSHRAIAAPFVVGSFDPNSGVQTAGTYNWSSKVTERNWSIGMGADWPISENSMLKGSLIYSVTDGNDDFASPLPTAGLQPLPNVDNTRKVTFNVRDVYQFSKQIELTGGVAYERYRYDDAAYDNYRNTIGAGTGTSYLSGAFALQNYTTTMVYLMGKYKF